MWLIESMVSGGSLGMDMGMYSPLSGACPLNNASLNVTLSGLPLVLTNLIFSILAPIRYEKKYLLSYKYLS
jgi:hypothetical protein